MIDFPLNSELSSIAKLKKAQGTQRWTALFKEIDAGAVGAKIRSNVRLIHAESGKFSLADAGLLAIVFDLPVATLFRIIEDGCTCPTGTWERVTNSGITAKNVIEAGKKKIKTLEES